MPPLIQKQMMTLAILIIGAYTVMKSDPTSGKIIAIARALIKRPKILIFDEATSSLDAATAEQFANTINQLKGKVTMMFITHAMPKNLLVDEAVNIGQGVLGSVGDGQGGDQQEVGV